MKKRVAIIYSGSRVWGGIETYLNNLIRDNKDNGIEFSIFTIGKWELPENLSREVLKDRVYFLPSRKISFSLLFGLGKILKSKEIDLIVSQRVVSNFYARVASIFSKTLQITVVHSDMDYEYNNLVIRYAYKLSDYLLRWKTSRFICVSNYLKEVLKRRGINDSKIKVIYNGLHFDSKVSKKKKTKEIVIGSMGRFKKEKGYDLLIGAAENLPSNVKIQIAGDGSEREKYEKIIQKKKLTKKVELVGYIKDTNSFLEKIDIYIQPSRSEGFGITVLEALAKGIPTIVSGEGALPEIVGNGKYGTIMKNLDSDTISETIKKIIENLDQERGKARRNSEEVKKIFSYQNWLKDTLEVLKTG